ncbi:heterokaryon incompatibility protein-domain-containing protein [Hypoxylon crocopeplum]|nr:heterokaryon incompatibility protein-domain-containing protein [Hypoxylon crocopeplum]
MQDQAQFGPTSNLDQYQYEALSCTDTLRIIALEPGDFVSPLRCSIIQYMPNDELTGIDNSRHYSAVSYCWGPADFSRRLLCVSQGKDEPSYLNITPNVDSILRHLRKKHKATYLWLDAVCLNQKDDIEKATQILRMGDIYRLARKVHIWLGDDQLDDSAKALALFRRLSIRTSKESEIPDQTDVACLVRFFEKFWFYRRWVIQEIALAQKITLHCGHYSLDLSWVMTARETIDHSFSLIGHSAYGLDILSTTIGRTQAWKGMSLLDMLWRFHQSECTEYKDRITSLLGLLPAGSNQIIPLNYAKIHWAEMYHQYALHFINQDIRTADTILIHLFDFGAVTMDATTPRPECPSWVPNWSGQRGRQLRDMGSFNVQVSKETMAERETIQADRYVKYTEVSFENRKKQRKRWESEAEYFCSRNCCISTLISANKNRLTIRWFVGAGGLYGWQSNLTLKLTADQSSWQDVIETLKPLRATLFHDDKRSSFRIYALLAAGLRSKNSLILPPASTATQSVPLIQAAIENGLRGAHIIQDSDVQILEEIGKLLKEYAFFRLSHINAEDIDRPKPGLDLFASYCLGPRNINETDVFIPLYYRDFSDDVSFASPHDLDRHMHQRGTLNSLDSRVETMMCVRPTSSITTFRERTEQEGHGSDRLANSTPKVFVNAAGQSTHSVPPREGRFIGPAFGVASSANGWVVPKAHSLHHQGDTHAEGKTRIPWTWNYWRKRYINARERGMACPLVMHII